MSEQKFAFPQYAKTTDQRVIDAIEDALATYQECRERAFDLSEKYTGERDRVYARGNWILGISVSGVNIRGLDDLPGQWTKPERGVSRPYKSNPAYSEFKALSTPPASIPGRASLEFGERFMGCGSLFVHNGTAYSRFTFQPDERRGDYTEFGWEEIKASEWHKANEDRSEQDGVA